MNETEIVKNATKLVKGEHVEVDGRLVFAQIARDQTFPCECCDLDAICTQESNALMDVCMECDRLTGKKHILSLVCSGRIR